MELYDNHFRCMEVNPGCFEISEQFFSSKLFDMRELLLILALIEPDYVGKKSTECKVFNYNLNLDILID